MNVNRLVNPLVREVGDEDIYIYISLERTSPRVRAIEFINRPGQPTQNFALSWRKQATDDVNSESFSVVSILVNGSCVLKARACREGLADSDIATSGLFDVSLRYHTKLVSDIDIYIWCVGRVWRIVTLLHRVWHCCIDSVASGVYVYDVYVYIYGVSGGCGG